MHIILIPGCNPGPYTGAGNNTYLIPGREPTLVDAATGHPGHLEALARALDGAPLRRVVVTHGHSDHAAGSEAIARRWPQAEFCKMPWPERDHRYAVDWRSLSADDRLQAGDRHLRVVHTPGHAPDHICLWDQETRTVFCGDLAIEGGTVMIPGSQGGNVRSYLDSLERVRALAPVRTLPAHGPEIPDLDRLVREYVDHRRRREAEIIAALASGPCSREILVATIYPGLQEGLLRPAGESVLAHLVSLRNEGRVHEEAGEWALTPLETASRPDRGAGG